MDMSIIKVKKGELFSFKGKRMYEPGEYLLFKNKPDDKKILEIFSPMYCCDVHGNRIGWICPLKKWVKKLINQKIEANIRYPKLLSDKSISQLIGADIDTRREWQKKFLRMFVSSLQYNDELKVGVIAPLGAGKCLFGLDITALGEHSLYVAPGYLHKQIELECERFERPKPEICTYESVKKKLGRNYDVIVADECSKIKNPESERTNVFKSLAANTPIVVGLTGTPASSREGLDLRWINGIIDGAMPDSENAIKFLFGINPREEIRTFTTVNDDLESSTNKVTLCEIDGWDSKGLTTFLKDEIYSVDVSSLYEEIPGIQYHDIELEMPKKFKLAKNGLLSSEGTSAKRLAQSRQITSGFYYTDDDVPKRDNYIKLSFIERWLEENPGESVVIYSHYREAQAILCEHLAHFNPAKVLSDEGANIGLEIERFKNKETKIMIATTAFAYGMNLMECCNNLIFESLPSSSELFTQAIGRVYRPGQKKMVNIFFLICENTLDRPAKELLLKHSDVNEAIMRAALLNELKRL